MQLTTTNFTIAEYCDQMENKKIVVNADYQRSGKVWPPAARSYLIDTILTGFPIPKLSLSQSTDIKTRQTVKEIVDGQQRSQTIYSFLHEEFRILGKSEFSGSTFSRLGVEHQSRFLDYALNVDIFLGATTSDIRQVFRRINAYNVPLNEAEKRHAVYQGEFKWFMSNLADKYDEALKTIGVITERQISRMADVGLLAEIVITLSNGIEHSRESTIDQFYAAHEEKFALADAVEHRIDSAFGYIFDWKDIHRSTLMKSYNFYSLLLAIMHTLDPVPALMAVYPIEKVIPIQRDIALTNLTLLADAQENPEEYDRYREFIGATQQGTNRLIPRQTRFKYFCRALTPQLLIPE